MRHELEVRMKVGSPIGVLSARVVDPDEWPPMPGASVQLRVVPTSAVDRYEYTIESGLPVRDHRGELALSDTGSGGTELMFTESFRPRIWGTGGFLRARRERILIVTARRWGDA